MVESKSLSATNNIEWSSETQRIKNVYEEKNPRKNSSWAKAKTHHVTPIHVIHQLKQS